MLRRRHIDPDPGGSRLRAILTAPLRLLRAIGWAIRERLLWPVADLFRSIGELLKWPFQRLGWGVERRVLWPSRERLASWGLIRRIAGAGALAVVAIGAAALGVFLASEEKPTDQLSAVSHLALANTESVVVIPAPAEPALRGTPPVFGVEDGVKVTNAKGGKEGGGASGVNGADKSDSGSAGGDTAEAGAAATSKQKPVPAGPAATKVARRFSEAFVFYEVGKRPERAKVIFEETAAPDLAEALIGRPPRLPEDAKVPKARVVNLVPGPRRAKTYSISVSLLRVGATSELRLSLQKKDGVWLVTDVRG